MIGFDLDKLRRDAREIFADYASAVAKRDTLDAHRCKTAITNMAMERLTNAIPPDARGLYVFKRSIDQPKAYLYIGIATKASFIERMKPRFRDENCFDEWPEDVEREAIWGTVYERICVSMGPRPGHPRGSSPEKKLDYAYQHTKTVNLFRKADELLFFSSEASPETIKSAESLLIYTGTSLGAPLLNIQERDKLSMNLDPGKELGLEIMNQLPNAQQWAEAAEAILRKFDGSCC